MVWGRGVGVDSALEGWEGLKLESTQPSVSLTNPIPTLTMA